MSQPGTPMAKTRRAFEAENEQDGVMTRKAPVEDINENELVVTHPKRSAAGLEAVVVALERGIAQAGVTRTARSLW